MILVTGPARSLVGGQSRHLDRLAAIAGRLGCKFEHVEIGRRAAEGGRLAMAARLLRDYRRVAMKIRTARASRGRVADEPVVLHVNSSVQYASLVRDIGFVAIGQLLHADLVIAQIHGCELEGPRDRRRLLRLLAWMLVAASDRVVVLGRSQATAIGGPAGAARIVPNTVVLQEPVRREARGGAAAPLRLLYLARMIPEKGLLRCLEAACLLRDAGIPFRLTLAGEGPLLKELPLRVRALRLESMVAVAGAVPWQQVRPLLSVHDLLWAPSTYAEGQPYALLEALEAGMPALACVPNAAMRELVDACDGALVPVAPDAQSLAALTVALAAAPGELARLQQLARQTAERRFSVDAVVPAWGTVWSLPADASSAAQPAG